jgi:DNA replication and repair protein RecF
VYVRALRLRDFRSWQRLEVELPPGVVVFAGPNGHGKTNLVEALGYLSTLSSHRVPGDGPLIRAGTESAKAAAAVINHQRELIVQVAINAGKANRAAINRTRCQRTRDILGILRTVVFAPEDLALVRGDPSERRRYVDELTASRRPAAAGVRAEYDKVVRQRTALLKRASSELRRGGFHGSVATLEAWNAHLAEYGSRLVASRLATVHQVAPHVAERYQAIAPSSRAAGLRYRSTLEVSLPQGFLDPGREPQPGDVEIIEGAFHAELAKAQRREIERGMSLVGPHRDDIEIELGGTPAKGFASHGESWSLALALRLGAFELMRGDGTDPVLILDDVFAELDATRRAALARCAAGVEQVLITAAVPEDIPAELQATRFDVRAEEGPGGRVSILEGPDEGRLSDISGFSPAPSDAPSEEVRDNGLSTSDNEEGGDGG